MEESKVANGSEPVEDQIPQDNEYRPIKCPRCKSKDLRYITEYHKCIWLLPIKKTLEIILVVAFFITLLPTLTSLFAGTEIQLDILMQALLGNGVLVVTLILYLVIITFIFITESRTHVKCICPHCGMTWNHSEY